MPHTAKMLSILMAALFGIQSVASQPYYSGMGGSSLANIIRQGHRVRRGIDWQSGTEDIYNGISVAGTTTENLGDTNVGQINVRWDGGFIGCYWMDAANGYELQLAQFNPYTGDFCWYFDTICNNLLRGVPMDGIIGNDAGTGADIDPILAPTISGGSAIQILAANGQYVDLGNHRTNCLGDPALCNPCQLICFWHYGYPGNGDEQFIIDGGGHFDKSYGLNIRRIDQEYEVTYKTENKTGADPLIWDVLWPMRDNMWHHVCVNFYYTTDLSGLHATKVYVNGKVIGSCFTEISLGANTHDPTHNNVWLGVRHTTQDRWFGNYKLDDLCISFDTCRTDEEVLAMYNAAKGNTCGYIQIPGQGMNCQLDNSVNSYIGCQAACHTNLHCEGFYYDWGAKECWVNDNSTVPQNGDCQGKDMYLERCACEQDSSTDSSFVCGTASYNFDEMEGKLIVMTDIIDAYVQNGAPTLVPGIRNMALRMSKDTNDAVLLGNHKHRCLGNLEHCTTGWCMSVWLYYPTALGGGHEVILESGGWWSSSYGITLFRKHEDGTTRFVSRDRTWKCKADFGVPPLNQWNHLVVCVDVSGSPHTVSSYLNGAPSSSTNTACTDRTHQPITAVVPHLNLGTNQAADDFFASFDIDELCFFEHQLLTAADVANLYSSYTP